MGIFNLKGFDNVFDQTLNNEIQDNIVEFLDWALLEKGNFFNVTLGETSPNGYDYSLLRPSSNTKYTTGTAWEGFRENWVWQSGVDYTPGPIVGIDHAYPGISGVYVEGNYKPIDTVGAYAHRVDYYEGTVIFDSALPTGTKIQAEHSYKWINVVYANEVPWLRDIQYRTYDKNEEFLNTDRGKWDKPADVKFQLPAIAIEIVPRRKTSGYALGGGQWVETDVLFHCMAEDENTRNKLVDIISLQNEKKILMFDSNVVAKSGAFPIDYRGTPVSGALRYPDLIYDYCQKPIRFSNSSVQGMDAINSNLYGGIVKLTAEVIQSNI
jgi:hypothetical protein